VGERWVLIVDDGALAATEEGWMVARSEETDRLYFVIERSACQDAKVLNDAWRAVAPLVIEQAVREGIVEWAPRPPLRVVNDDD